MLQENICDLFQLRKLDTSHPSEHIFCVYVCLCVSSGRLVGQHVSAPAVSLSQAVISTYHSDRPESEDTGTHNPHSGFPLLHFNI